MPKRKLTSEENKEYVRGEEMSEFVKSNGWHIAKDILFNKIAQLNDISSLVTDDRTKEALGEEAFARASAVQIILEWIQEIEGMKESHDQLKKSLVDRSKNEYVKRYPNQKRD